MGRLDSYRICGILRSDSPHSNSKSLYQIFVQSSRKKNSQKNLTERFIIINVQQSHNFDTRSKSNKNWSNYVFKIFALKYFLNYVLFLSRKLKLLILYDVSRKVIQYLTEFVCFNVANCIIRDLIHLSDCSYICYIFDLRFILQFLGCVSDRQASQRVNSFPMKDMHSRGSMVHPDARRDAPVRFSKIRVTWSSNLLTRVNPPWNSNKIVSKTEKEIRLTIVASFSIFSRECCEFYQ